MVKAIAKVFIRVVIIFAFIFLIGYGIFMGLYYYTSTPEFCSSCHYVEPYVTSWSKSPHNSVNCMGCHEPTGSLGKLHSKSRGLNYYVSDLTGNYIIPIIEAPFISEEKCFGCHVGAIRDYSHVIKISDDQDHLQYIQNEQKCISCHNNTGHMLNIGIEALFTKKGFARQ